MTSLFAPSSTEWSFANVSPGECSSLGAHDTVAHGVWDAIVIGAGPAGAAAGFLLARRGWRVLLLERSNWPREKVCGGCLSASAIASLREIGLSHLLADATRITQSQLHHARSHASLPIQDSFAIHRSVFDARLVDAFLLVGGTFVPGASASLLASDQQDDARALRVNVNARTISIRGRVVLACDGLGGTSLSEEPWANWTIAPDAYIGVATSLDGDEMSVEDGTIQMHIGSGGYVGAVRHADGSVHLAAALDSARCREAGGPARLMESILESCGRTVSLGQKRLRGSPMLTRVRRALGGDRVLAVGDACGYIEPFTGEGIAWALRSAIEATSLLDDTWDAQVPQRWREAHRAAVGSKQMICRAVRFAVRRPILANAGIGLLKRMPGLSSWITREGMSR